MALSEKKRVSNDRWIKENYKQVKLSMPNEEADSLDEHCKEFAYTKAGFIRDAIKGKIQQDICAKAADTSQGGVLVLRELGYDPVAQKPLYVEETTGKQYFVEQVKEETDVEEPNEDEIPF